MNKIILIGRITKQPELKTTTSGTEVLSNSIAVQRKFKSQSGDYEADFFNFVAYGATANLIASYFQKGDRIGIEGRLQARSYQKEDGTTAFVTEVIVENIEFLQEKREQQPQPQRTQPAPAPKPNNSFDLDDSDLPF